MSRYPKDLPVFEIIADRERLGPRKCGCAGLHSEGAPTIYGGQRIDLWSCAGFCEPFDLDEIKPLNKLAKDMVKAVREGVKFPYSPWNNKRGDKLV
jgi:hypothetical protein